MAPKSEEIMDGPGDWGLEWGGVSAVRNDTADAQSSVESLRNYRQSDRSLPCPMVEFKA
jgi:hypothetical protein